MRHTQAVRIYVPGELMGSPRILVPYFIGKFVSTV